MSVGNLSIFDEFLSHFYPRYLSAVAIPTGMCRDERSVDCLVLRHSKRKRKVTAKSVTMPATPYVKIKWLQRIAFKSILQECLLIFDLDLHYLSKQLLNTFFEIVLLGKTFDMQ